MCHWIGNAQSKELEEGRQGTTNKSSVNKNKEQNKINNKDIERIE